MVYLRLSGMSRSYNLYCCHENLRTRILKWILEKDGVMMWTWRIWFSGWRQERVVGSGVHGNGHSDALKGVSPLAEQQLASHEGLLHWVHYMIILVSHAFILLSCWTRPILLCSVIPWKTQLMLSSMLENFNNTY